MVPTATPRMSDPLLFEQLFEFAPDALLVVQKDGTITSANRQAQTTFGHAREALLGRSVDELVPPSVRPAHAALRAGFGAAPRERLMGTGLTLHACHADGHEFPVEVALRPLEGESSPLVLVLVRDVTERKAAAEELRRAHDELEQRVLDRTRELSLANQQLRTQIDERLQVERRLREEQAKLLRAEKLSSLGMLAAGVAHEINNPIMGLLGCLRTLASEELPRERTHAYVETMREALERMKVTTQALLDYGRPRPAIQEQIDVRKLSCDAASLLRPAARLKHVQLKCEAHEPLYVWGDRGQLTQVIVNVVMNAIYATPSDGLITLTSRREPPSRIALSVVDTGPGIPDYELAKVCDPFFSTKPEGEGTGLGLAVAQGIVAAHGGELQLTNGTCGGAQVDILLPEVAAGA